MRKPYSLFSDLYARSNHGSFFLRGNNWAALSVEKKEIASAIYSLGSNPPELDGYTFEFLIETLSCANFSSLESVIFQC